MDDDRIPDGGGTPPLFNKTEIEVRLKKLWAGDIPLFQTFWIYYFAGVFVLKILASLSGSLAGIFDILALAWAAFMIKPILESADRYQGEKLWTVLAKIGAGLIALGIIVDLT